MAITARPKIQMIVATTPPRVCGIGDYTARLAARLAPFASVKLLTGQAQAYDEVPNVTVEPVFTRAEPQSVRQLVESVDADPPDWLVLQYDPFSYGHRGLNLHLPWAVRQIKKRHPKTRFLLMAHEAVVPVVTLKQAVQTLWLRRQLRLLGRSADAVFFSTQAWAHLFSPWFPGVPVAQMPIGSNIPRVEADRADVRARLGIAENVCVLGLFGMLGHSSRALPLARAAALAARQNGWDVLALYLGPDKDAVCKALEGITVRADGALPGEEVSRRFAAMDIFLLPFSEGVSSRRTSLITGLQHGAAIVTTAGKLTDATLRSEHEKAFLLTDTDSSAAFGESATRLLADDTLRAHLRQGARHLYETRFSWDAITARWMDALELRQASN